MDKPLRLFIEPPYGGLTATVGSRLNIGIGSTGPLPREVVFPPVDPETGDSPSHVLMVEAPAGSFSVQACSSGFLTIDGNKSLVDINRSRIDLMLTVRSIHEQGDVGDLFQVAFPGRGSLAAFVYLNLDIASVREAILDLLVQNAGIDETDQLQREELWLKFLAGEEPGLFVTAGTRLGQAAASGVFGRRKVGFVVDSTTGAVNAVAFYRRMQPLVRAPTTDDPFAALLTAPEVDPLHERSDIVQTYASRVSTRVRRGTHTNEVTLILHGFDIATETFKPSELKPEHIMQLNMLVQLFTTSGSRLRIIDIVGNASETGKDHDQDASNRRYSRNRALAVWLVLKNLSRAQGDSKPELELPSFRALGSRRPLVPGGAEEALNRSVHITYLWSPPVVEPEAPPPDGDLTTSWKIDLSFSVEVTTSGVKIGPRALGRPLGLGGVAELGTLTKIVGGRPKESRHVLLLSGGLVASMGPGGDAGDGDSSAELGVGVGVGVASVSNFGVPLDSQYIHLGQGGAFTTFETVDFDWFEGRSVYVGGVSAAFGIATPLPGVPLFGAAVSGSATLLLMPTLYRRYPRIVGTALADLSAGKAEMGLGAKLVGGRLFIAPKDGELLSLDSAARIFAAYMKILFPPVQVADDVVDLIKDIKDFIEQLGEP